MKTALKISVALNLGLLGGLVWLAIQSNPPKAAVVITAPISEIKTETPPSAGNPVAVTPPTSSAEAPAFHWSQLTGKEKDYRAYVKNLRAIGCPEAALRAIVAADVHAVNQTQINDLEKKLVDITSSPWSIRLANYGAEQSIKNAITKLTAAEPATTSDLLGVPAAPAATDPGSAANQAAATQGNNNSAQITGDATMPLVLQNIDPTSLNLNNQQLQVIDSLRASFVGQVADLANKKLSNPADQQLWQQAQLEADTQLQAQLGTDLFNKFQQLAGQQAGNQPVLPQ